MTQLSLADLVAARWRAWGCDHVQRTVCDGCGTYTWCRGKTRRLLLCIDCYDLSRYPR